jgi:hypothetical protein
MFVLSADEELMSALHKSHILRSSSICKYSKKQLFCFDHSISSMESCLLFFVFRDGALTHCGLHLFKRFVSELAKGNM